MSSALIHLLNFATNSANSSNVSKANGASIFTTTLKFNSKEL
jgi:hypothetical protein